MTRLWTTRAPFSLLALSGMIWLSASGMALAQGNAGNPSGAPTSEISPFPSTRPAPTSVTPFAPAPQKILPTTPGGVLPPVTQPNATYPAGGSFTPAGGTTQIPTLQSIPEPQSSLTKNLAPPPESRITADAPGGLLEPVTLRATLHKTQLLPLSLEDALKLADGQNISIDIAKENASFQKGDYLLRLSDLLPDIVAEYRQSTFTGGIQVFSGIATEVTRTTFQPQLSANYTIYTGGRNLFDIRASKQRLEALRKQTEDTRQDTLQQVALAYYNLLQAYWQRIITVQAIKEAEYQVSLNEARFKAGIGLELDLLQAQSNLSLRQQELVKTEELLSQASELLRQLLNLDFNVDIQPSSIDAVLAQLIAKNMTIEQLMDIANRNNPRIAMLRRMHDVGRSYVHVAVADLFPQVTLSAYVNKTGENPQQALPSRFAGLQATWDLLENMGAARPLAIRQARVNAKLADLNLEQGQRLLEQNIANSWVSLHALEKTVQSARDTLRYSSAVYQQAAGRLHEGVGTNVELELSMTNLSRARTNLALAFLNYNRMQVTLLYNLGVATPKTLTSGYKPAISP